jgi:hypothetical protein
MGPRALGMVGKHSTMSNIPSSVIFFFFLILETESYCWSETQGPSMLVILLLFLQYWGLNSGPTP